MATPLISKLRIGSATLGGGNRFAAMGL